MLLGRRAHDPDAGLWDVLGGFVDEGEHPLDALRRELDEETGLGVEPGAFLGAFIDTYGEDPEATSVLNLVWEARIVSGDPSPADDVSELRWFPQRRTPAARGVRVSLGRDVPAFAAKFRRELTPAGRGAKQAESSAQPKAEGRFTRP